MPCQKCGGELKPSKYEGGKPYCPVCYKKYKQFKEQQNQSSTAKPFIPVERKSLKDEPEYRVLVMGINELKRAVHALWAVNIQGDTVKERAYELHKIPLIAKSTPAEAEIDVDDLPF